LEPIQVFGETEGGVDELNEALNHPCIVPRDLFFFFFPLPVRINFQENAPQKECDPISQILNAVQFSIIIWSP
jgi:hypothetical protein